MAIERGSKKTEVVEALYRLHGVGHVVSAEDVKSVMQQLGVSLSNNNPANFLKDLIRYRSVNSNWPASLTQERISARQRYGSGQVLEFFRHPDDWPTPFIDRFHPTVETSVHTVEAASLPYLARSLGRTDEAALIQVVVNQRLVETQLAVCSKAEPIESLRDISHLQMSVKTQPEIDALFVASYNRSSKRDSEELRHVLVTCEAKQRKERILEDQIREQVRMAFKMSSKLKGISIDEVKPLAVQVLRVEHLGRSEAMIFMVEFEAFGRETFARAYLDPDPEVYWTLPLVASSCTLFRLSPPLKTVGLPQKIRQARAPSIPLLASS